MEPTDWALDGNVCLGLEMYSQVWMSICMCGGRCLCIQTSLCMSKYISFH